MSLSEACSCGASFQAERSDELKLLNQWREQHKCPSNDTGGLVVIDSARSDAAPDFTVPEMHIGFRMNEEDDE